MATRSSGGARSRDLRDRPLGRVALLVAVLLLALGSARACRSTDGISSEQAVELARAEAPFTADRTQVRLVQQGIPPRAFWAVSLYDVGPSSRVTRVVVYLVDRKTGTLTRR